MEFSELKKENVKLTVIEEKETDENYFEIKVNRNFLNTIFLSMLKFKNSNPEIEEQITPREKEILEKIAEGKDNNEIGAELYISGHTVKAHIKNIFQKLNVEDRTKAVIEAIRYNLIDIYT